MTTSLLNSRAKTNTGVVFTPVRLASEMVKEALYYRLKSDYPTLTTSEYGIFHKGESSPSTGKKLLDKILAYVYLDPAVGEGIFLRILLEDIHFLVQCYQVPIKNNWGRQHLIGWDIDKNTLDENRKTFSHGVNLIHGDYLTHTISQNVDVVIANPPYIRQELISSDYKQSVLNEIRLLWPTFSVSARSDAYVLFLLKAAHQLKPGGVFTFIIPNGWMDSDYGETLRELFRSFIQVNSIRDSAQRHFAVDVNTVILTATKTRPGTASQIQLKVDSDKKIINQDVLTALDLGWYGSLFRCPDWLLNEIRLNDRIKQLSQLFNVATGIITGNNKQYYQPARPNENYIAAVRSPREVKAIEFRKKDSRNYVQIKNVHYKVRRAPLLWADLRGGRHLVAWNRDNLPFEHTFYGLTPVQGEVSKWAILLNSSWIWLMVEIFGRKSLGGGAIRLVKSDLQKLPIPNLDQLELPPGLNGFLTRPITNWQKELEQPDRQQLDKIVFDFLNLSERYEESIALLKALISRREKKAGN